MALCKIYSRYDLHTALEMINLCYICHSTCLTFSHFSLNHIITTVNCGGWQAPLTARLVQTVHALKLCHSDHFSRILWFYWRFGVVVNAFVSINEVNLHQARLVLGWVTVSGVQLLVQENLSQYITSHPGQLSLAIPPWVGAMSQRAVMSCGWGVKAGMVRKWIAGKTVWPLAITGISTNGFIP